MKSLILAICLSLFTLMSFAGDKDGGFPMDTVSGQWNNGDGIVVGLSYEAVQKKDLVKVSAKVVMGEGQFVGTGDTYHFLGDENLIIPIKDADNNRFYMVLTAVYPDELQAAGQDYTLRIFFVSYGENQIFGPEGKVFSRVLAPSKSS